MKSALKKNILQFIIIASATLLLSSSHSPIEDFVLFDIHGKKHTFHGLIGELPDRGRLIVNFTSVDCKPCKKEIPELVEIHKETAGKNRLLIIYAECCQVVKDHAATLGILDKSFVDPFRKIRDLFQVNGFPVTFVIGKDGKITGRYDGYTKSGIDAIRKALK